MKKSIILSVLLLLFISIIGFGQITITKSDGGSVVVKLGLGSKINEKSTLTRQLIVLNDAKCPLQIDEGAGIFVTYNSTNVSFYNKSEITPTEPINAYEIHYVIYDVFGSHIKTLSGTDVQDIVSKTRIGGGWYANENQVSEYLFCVSYVAKVRTKSGVVWFYNPDIIKEELNKIQINYEENYKPKEKPETI